jgi:hypothetical protein
MTKVKRREITKRRASLLRGKKDKNKDVVMGEQVEKPARSPNK